MISHAKQEVHRYLTSSPEPISSVNSAACTLGLSRTTSKLSEIMCSKPATTCSSDSPSPCPSTFTPQPGNFARMMRNYLVLSMSLSKTIGTPLPTRLSSAQRQ